MIIFSTPNGHSLSYLPTHGILMLQMMGCIPAHQASNQTSNASVKVAGVIPLEAVKDALAALKLQSSLLSEQFDTQHNNDRDSGKALHSSDADVDENEQGQNEYEPSVASRAYPLLKLLEAAIQEQQPVMWQDSSKV